MTDTAKPTPWDKVTDETLEVFYEIGLTPRQLLDRLNHLQQGYSKTQHEIKQVLGKALGNYPWYKDDQKNFPSATDADGVCVGEHVAETIAEEAANVIVQMKKQRDKLLYEVHQWNVFKGWMGFTVDASHEQVMDKVSEWFQQMSDLEAALFQLYNYALNRGHDDDFPLQISILIRQAYEAALAKGGKVGVE